MSTAQTRHETPSGRFDVRTLLEGEAATESALALVLVGSPETTPMARRRVEQLRQLAARQNLRVELLVAAYNAYEPVSAALAVEAPGKTAIVYTPPGRLAGDALEATRDVLLGLSEAAWARGLSMLQALITPDDQERARVHLNAGYRFLAELIYMDRPAGLAPPNLISTTDLRLHTYTPERRELFLDALNRSYVNSRDCPGLTGLRDTQDVLVGHQATGLFNPEHWFVATVGSEPVGVLLSARVVNRSAMEVVYMGVSEAWRGKGVANRLMNRAVELARAERVSAVTLAVDGTNEPARAFYHRWMFEETARRRAWIASPVTR
jgi:ribosomal protein S18 acetylase RimI-like enzyme